MKYEKVEEQQQLKESDVKGAIKILTDSIKSIDHALRVVDVEYNRHNCNSASQQARIRSEKASLDRRRLALRTERSEVMCAIQMLEEQQQLKESEMELETLKGVESINNHGVAHFPDEYGHPIEGCENHIKINHEINEITFKIQDGAIKENGHNGCQVDEVIETAKIIVEGLNKKFPCRENSLALTKLDEALMWLRERKRDRAIRGVEGTNQA